MSLRRVPAHNVDTVDASRTDARAQDPIRSRIQDLLEEPVEEAYDQPGTRPRAGGAAPVVDDLCIRNEIRWNAVVGGHVRGTHHAGERDRFFVVVDPHKAG